MKISAQEEYGLRILLLIATTNSNNGITLQQISAQESISMPYAGKIIRILRQGKLVESHRGKDGGYTLMKEPSEMPLNEILPILGSPLYSEEFCGKHQTASPLCTNSVDCAVQSLWQIVQKAVSDVLMQYTLADLTESSQMQKMLTYLETIEQNELK